MCVWIFLLYFTRASRVCLIGDRRSGTPPPLFWKIKFNNENMNRILFKLIHIIPWTIPTRKKKLRTIIILTYTRFNITLTQISMFDIRMWWIFIGIDFLILHNDHTFVNNAPTAWPRFHAGKSEKKGGVSFVWNIHCMNYDSNKYLLLLLT